MFLIFLYFFGFSFWDLVTLLHFMGFYEMLELIENGSKK
jgi:hypothetical protein